MRLIRQPTKHSVNPLNSNGFQFNILKIPEVSYFSQSVQLPDISLPSVTVASSSVAVHLTGDTPEFGQFTLTFMVDEDMSNYLAIYYWMIGSSFVDIMPEGFTGMTKLEEYSDATLHVLDSSNNIVRVFEFHDLRPNSLGGFAFETTNPETTYITCTATFDYTYFKPIL